MNLSTWLRILPRLEREYEPNDEISLRDRIDQARDYVDNHVYRADVVTVIPASAPAGYLMVKAGDINLYVGTGAGNPLRKIPTQAV